MIDVFICLFYIPTKMVDKCKVIELQHKKYFLVTSNDVLIPVCIIYQLMQPVYAITVMLLLVLQLHKLSA